EGKVAFVHPHLDAASRTLRVRFDLDNPRHELRPGMYATVTLDVPAAQSAALGVALAEDWRDGLLGGGRHHPPAAPGPSRGAGIRSPNLGRRAAGPVHAGPGAGRAGERRY